MQGTGAIVRVLGACDHAWMRRFHVVFALFAGACTPACPPGLMPGTAVDLYYGRGGVAEADWQDYLERLEKAGASRDIDTTTSTIRHGAPHGGGCGHKK